MRKIKDCRKIVIKDEESETMYGTTMRSFNENKGSMTKKEKRHGFFFRAKNSKKEAKKLRKREADTQYMRLNDTSCNKNEEDGVVNEGFSIKDLPIASVVVTLVLTMMLLVMTSGFGGL